MSKHWDPAWQRETITYKGDIAAAIRRGRERRLKGTVPDAYKDPERCMREGLARIAILGPDHATLVAAVRRHQAGPFQERVGRFTWYFLCTRPRIRAIPAKCRIAQGWAELAFTVERDDGSVKRLSLTERQGDPGVLGIDVLDQGENIVVHSVDGDATQDAALIAQGMRRRAGWAQSDFDLEIRYIGRARGTLRESSALDRLESHEKYQRVLEELRQPRRRNRDPWVLLASGTTMETATFTDESALGDSVPSDEELERADAVARTALTTSARVDLVEAMLINHFRPELNTHHVEKLDLRGSVMETCREAGLTGVTLAFSSTSLGVACYTERRPRSMHGALTVCL